MFITSIEYINNNIVADKIYKFVMITKHNEIIIVLFLLSVILLHTLILLTILLLFPLDCEAHRRC